MILRQQSKNCVKKRDAPMSLKEPADLLWMRLVIIGYKKPDKNQQLSGGMFAMGEAYRRTNYRVNVSRRRELYAVAAAFSEVFKWRYSN